LVRNLLGRRQAHCQKIVQELNPYGNLFFNLCDEPWFYHQEHPGFVSQPPPAVKVWIRRVADEEPRLPNRHLLDADISYRGTVLTQENLGKYFDQSTKVV
jgi:hypothetical protein